MGQMKAKNIFIFLFTPYSFLAIILFVVKMHFQKYLNLVNVSVIVRKDHIFNYFNIANKYCKKQKTKKNDCFSLKHTSNGVMVNWTRLINNC